MNKNQYAIACTSQQDLMVTIPQVRYLIESLGFCVLSAWDNSMDTFKKISSLFGNPQLHVRSDAEGFVGGGESISNTWQAYKNEYRGITNDEFHPHTDGSFVKGMISIADKAIKVNPPKMLLLQCVKQADDGGTNVLVDSKPIFAELKFNYPEMLNILTTPGCVTFCRDDQLAMDLPVYQQVNQHLYYIRFRYDAATYTPQWSKEAVERLHYDYHLNERYRIKIDLQENDILIVDNLRVLHGRDAFTNVELTKEARKLRRVWIGDDTEVLFNVENAYREQRAIAPYQYYKVIEKSEPAYLADLKLGISVTDGSDMKNSNFNKKVVSF